MQIQNLTTDTFDSAISQGTVLVDFWAEWCPPCKMLTPTLEAFAAKHADRVTVCKVNVDDEQALAVRFGILSIPTILLFRDGVESAKHVGLLSLEALEGMID